MRVLVSVSHAKPQKGQGRWEGVFTCHSHDGAAVAPFCFLISKFETILSLTSIVAIAGSPFPLPLMTFYVTMEECVLLTCSVRRVRVLLVAFLEPLHPPGPILLHSTVGEGTELRDVPFPARKAQQGLGTPVCIPTCTLPPPSPVSQR